MTLILKKSSDGLKLSIKILPKGSGAYLLFRMPGHAIEKMSSIADLMIVSQTPLEALEREWREHNLEKHIIAIAGQEHGTKTEHIALAAKTKYPDNKILMIGDARGDLEAAKNNGISFFPIIPGKEDSSWERFTDEGLEKFRKGLFEGSYETGLLSEFEESLPDKPPWNE